MIVRSLLTVGLDHLAAVMLVAFYRRLGIQIRYDSELFIDAIHICDGIQIVS